MASEKNSCRGASAFLLTGLFLLVTHPIPSLAGDYDALCQGLECKIIIDGKGFSGPAGFMPSHRIAQWYTGGGEEHNGAASAVGATGGAMGGAVVGAVATCWTIILCPFGLIGGAVAGGMGGSQAGKSADFYFTVIGYNQSGDKIVQSFNFVNKKPASRLMQELPALTGLGMGELRSLDAIKAGDARAAQGGTGKEQLPVNIGPSSPMASNNNLPNKLNDAHLEAVSGASSGSVPNPKCWSSFLMQNGMKEWANKNTRQANDLRKKYDAC